MIFSICRYPDSTILSADPYTQRELYFGLQKPNGILRQPSSRRQKRDVQEPQSEMKKLQPFKTKGFKERFLGIGASNNIEVLSLHLDGEEIEISSAEDERPISYHMPIFTLKPQIKRSSYFFPGSGLFYRKPDLMPAFYYPPGLGSYMRIEMQFHPLSGNMVLFIVGNEVQFLTHVQ